jgi:hypothetical protein
MTFSCLHLLKVLCVALNTLQALCGLYATACTSFIVRQNKKASRLTTRLEFSKSYFCTCVPYRNTRRKIQRKSLHSFTVKRAITFLHDLTSTSGFATARNHRSLDSQFTSYLRSTNLQFTPSLTLHVPGSGSCVCRPHKHCVSHQHGNSPAVTHANVLKHYKLHTK